MKLHVYLFVASAISLNCGWAGGAVGQELTLHAPSKINGLLIGDPIYFPLAIANYLDNETVGETGLGLNAKIRVTVRSGDAEVFFVLQTGWAGGLFRRYAPKTLETSVLLINLWTRRMTAEILRHKTCEISLDIEGVPVHRSTLTFVSNTFTSKGMEIVTQNLIRNEDKQPRNVGPATASIYGWKMLGRGATPLQWVIEALVPDDRVGSSPEAVARYRTKFRQAGWEFVDKHCVSNCKLRNAMEFDRVMAPLLDPTGEMIPSVKQWEDAAPRFQQIFNRVSVNEGFFMASHMAKATYYYEQDLGPGSAKPIRNLLADISPTHLGLIAEKPSWSMHQIMATSELLNARPTDAKEPK